MNTRVNWSVLVLLGALPERFGQRGLRSPQPGPHRLPSVRVGADESVFHWKMEEPSWSDSPEPVLFQSPIPGRHVGNLIKAEAGRRKKPLCSPGISGNTERLSSRIQRRKAAPCPRSESLEGGQQLLSASRWWWRWWCAGSAAALLSLTHFSLCPLEGGGKSLQPRKIGPNRIKSHIDYCKQRLFWFSAAKQEILNQFI